jgi:cobalt-zinc-cadmium efflux system membrane fusion protein
MATIVDLSTVWVIADVAERDLSRVRVGTPATITPLAFPDLALTGRVNYIDAQLSAATRTAKVRIEVANPDQRLRLGMLAEARLGGEAGLAPAVTIPRAAVQTIADRSVVYVADPAKPDDLVERTVRLGEVRGDRVAVVAGLEAGERVVSAGSFHVRAERERLGLGDPAPTPDAPSAASADGTRPQTATITVTKDGFTPATVTLRAGVPARLTFVRTSNETCATQVVVPSLKIERPLPLNTPVVVELAAAKAGTIEFACGMDMLKGAIVIE